MKKFLVSFLLLCCIFAGTVFADTRDWDFGNPTQYLYETDKAEVSAGSARIRKTYSGPSWWNENYQCRKKIMFLNPNTADLPDSYSVSYTEADPAVLARMLGDRRDLRVVYWDSSLDTWVGGSEGLDRHMITPGGADTVTIWFMLQKPISGLDGDTYYIYYGNAAAETPPQDLERVYLFGDDFSGTSIDTASKWTEIDNENYFVQNDKLIVTYGINGWNRGMYSIKNFDRADTLCLEYDYTLTGGRADPYRAFMQGWKDSTTGISYTNLIYAFYLNGGGTGSSPWTTWVYEDGASRGAKTGSWVLGTLYRVRFILKSGGGCVYQQSTDSGSTWVTSYDSNYSTESPVKIGFCNHSQALEIDNLRVRKYIPSEPVANSGVEEEFLYRVDDPSIQPQAAQKQLFSSITVFSETAVKPAGSEIRYLLSNNMGSAWQYWDGADWVTSSGTYTQANTAVTVNAHIDSFPLGEANFLFKALLHSDTGMVTPQLDNVQITYQNFLPVVETTYPTQSFRVSVADINETTPIKIDFDKPMSDTDSWSDSGYLVLRDADYNTVTFSIVYDSVSYSVFIVPDTLPLDYCKNYQIFVSRFVKGENGLPLGDDYILSFTTMIESTWGATIAYPTGEAVLIINSGVLPQDAYVKLDKQSASSLSSAYYDARVSPSLRPLQDIAYPIEATDANSNPLVGVLGGNVTLQFSYNDADADGYIDGTLTEEKYLSVFLLDEASNRWVKLDNCILNENANEIRVEINHLSSFMVMGYSSPDGVLSGVINYPNPFAAGKEQTKIVYTLTKNCNVTLMIYNLVGDLVRRLEFVPGSEGGKGTVSGYQNVVSWDGKNGLGMTVANGMYICHIAARPSDGSSGSEKILRIGVLK